MDFLEVENRFRWLEEQVRGGQLTELQYRASLAELRVVDAAGYTWMLQEHSGVWHVYKNGQWNVAQPPRTAPPQYVPPPPAPQYNYNVQPAGGYPQPAGGYPAAAASPTQGKSVVGKYFRYFLIWLGAWLLIGLGVYVFVARDQPEVLYGVAAAAVLSLVLVLFSLGSSWQGQVVEVRVVQERIDDESSATRDVTYAYIRQPNGKIRREHAMNDWRVGDWLVKRQGETAPKKQPHP